MPILASNLRHAKEAIAAAKTSIELDENNVDPYLVLAASCAALGLMDEASRATSEVLKLKPGFKLTSFAATQPYKEQADLDRLTTQLERAGFV